MQTSAAYVLVDDVITMGGTLAELAHYIQSNGGSVVGVMVLVNTSRSGSLVPERRVATELEDGMDQPFETSSASAPPLSPPTKPHTSSVSVRLTRSEIDALRQSKRRISDCVQKVFAGTWAAKPGR